MEVYSRELNYRILNIIDRDDMEDTERMRFSLSGLFCFSLRGYIMHSVFLSDINISDDKTKTKSKSVSQWN